MKSLSLFERIDTICLHVKDVERASRWYQNVLGLKESFAGETYRILTIGNSAVPLTLEEDEGTASKSVYPIFFTKNIEEVYHLLKEKKVMVSELQNDQENILIYMTWMEIGCKFVIGNKLEFLC